MGARPEIIRLAAVINKCRKYFDCILAHTGQNYDYNLNGIFFRDLGLADPDVYMNSVVGALIDHDTVIEEGTHLAPGAIVKAENRIPAGSKIESGMVIENRQYPL